MQENSWNPLKVPQSVTEIIKRPGQKPDRFADSKHNVRELFVQLCERGALGPGREVIKSSYKQKHTAKISDRTVCFKRFEGEGKKGKKKKKAGHFF